MRSLGLATLSVALSSGAVAALDVDECSSAMEIMWPHEDMSGFEDLGSSLVMFVDSHSIEGNSGADVNFVQCSSGNTLIVEGYEQTVGGAETDKLEQAKFLTRQMVAGEQSYSFSDAVKFMASKGLEARFDKATEEICACKALYPNDRGSKTPYKYISKMAN